MKHNPKWWDHLLMRAQNVAGFVLSIGAILAIVVVWGNIPSRLASAEAEIITVQALQSDILVKMARLETGQDYTNKTLDEIKVALPRR